jgi:hypothetical protein
MISSFDPQSNQNLFLFIMFIFISETETHVSLVKPRNHILPLVISVPITTKVVSSNPTLRRGVLDKTLCDKVGQ